MKYRKFLDLTNAEIRFIVSDIFNPTRIFDICRDKKRNEITLNIVTDGWQDGERDNFEIIDEVVLSLPNGYHGGISSDFPLSREEELKWEKYLLAKGCDHRLKDNPYLE